MVDLGAPKQAQKKAAGAIKTANGAPKPAPDAIKTTAPAAIKTTAPGAIKTTAPGAIKTTAAAGAPKKKKEHTCIKEIENIEELQNIKKTCKSRGKRQRI